MAKSQKLKVEFIGMNAEHVTGSMIYVHNKDVRFLIEAGLYQSNDVAEDYKVNNRNLNFDVKKLDFILLGHMHADHSMLVPRLVKDGFVGRIIMPKGSKNLFKTMALDSAYIVERDCQTLDNRHKKNHIRTYTKQDVIASMDLIDEYTMNKKFDLNDFLSIEFVPSGHIVHSAQIMMWVKTDNVTTRIGYTGDIGNIKVKKYYVDKFKKLKNCNILIGESTYSHTSSEITNKVRKNDIKILKQHFKESTGITLFPIFTLDRCPNLLTLLYDLFGSDHTFKKQIVIDSPLAVELLKLYTELLTGDDLVKLESALAWKNVVMLRDYKSSKAYMETAKDCVVLAASGMMNNGRSNTWAKHILENKSNTIIFVGYASEGTLSHTLKTSTSPIVQIGNLTYANACKKIDLKSFTSHMQYSDMLAYYSSIQADKILLVHGDKATKDLFAEALREELSKKLLSGKVVNVDRKTVLEV